MDGAQYTMQLRIARHEAGWLYGVAFQERLIQGMEGGQKSSAG